MAFSVIVYPKQFLMVMYGPKQNMIASNVILLSAEEETRRYITPLLQ